MALAGVKTLLAPMVCTLSEAAKVKPMLLLDRYSQINVIVVDDIDHYLLCLKIAEEKRISFNDIINANLVYGLADRIGLRPGMFIDGDEALRKYLLTCFSGNIFESEREKLVEELEASWRRVCESPLAHQYRKLSENQCIDSIGNDTNPPLPRFDAYEVFINDYYCGLMNLFCSQRNINISLFLQLTEILQSSLQAKPYQGNYFLRTAWNIQRFKAKMEEVYNLNNKIREAIAQFENKFNEEKGTWFTDVKGWADLELQGLEKQHSPLPLGEALANLLEMRVPLCASVNVNESFNGLLEVLSCTERRGNFPLEDCRWPRNMSLSQKISKTKLAIEYAVFAFARENNIEMYFLPEEDNFPFFHLAGRGEEAEEELLGYFLDEEKRTKLAPYELYAICLKAKNELLQTAVRQFIQTKAGHEQLSQLILRFQSLSLGLGTFQRRPRGLEAILKPQPPAFTPRYTALERTIKGEEEVVRVLPLSSSLQEKDEIDIYDLSESRKTSESEGKCYLM